LLFTRVNLCCLSLKLSTMTMASLHLVEKSVSPECRLTRQSGAARLISA
jgi:hypothetical protein